MAEREANGIGERRQWLAAQERLEAAPQAVECHSSHKQTHRPAERNTMTRRTPSFWCQWKGGRPLERLLGSLLLPLVCILLLPTWRPLVPNQSPEEADIRHGMEQVVGLSLIDSNGPAGTLLALLRLPFEKFVKLQLAGGGLIGGAYAREISSKHDLQEEETHALLLGPAEHRTATSGGASYLLPASTQHHLQRHLHHAHPNQNPYETAPAAVAPSEGPNDGYASGGGPDSMGGGGGGAIDAHATSGVGLASVEPAQSGASSTMLQSRSDLPAVRALNVKCEKNHMTVNIVFDQPFYGMVFSKGHYNDQKCVHLPPNSGQTSVNFDIHLGKCGMSSSDANSLTGSGNNNANTATALQQHQQQQQQQQPNGLFIENTIIIQYDPLVQEIYDQARKLRCTWYDYYEKSVTFRPYNVDMLDAVTANFLGDNIQCWMQIQVGKGPWSSEVAGIVKIGQTMTMVLAIKDDENRFDMLVRNCVAHDGKHQPIQLVDEYGCVARPKIMSKFQKIRNFGPAATVVSYAHFQAFKFPDSMSVHFQCVIQVCRYECPEPVCSGQQQPGELTGGGGNGAGPLGGSSQNGGAGGPGDYATSGTEMVASKEPLPIAAGVVSPNSGGGGAGNTIGYLMSNSGLSMNGSSSQLAPLHGGSNVQLKLDESQGRVQVKLDTSMMAGLSARGHPQAPQHLGAPYQNGPLPPHLLHMAASSGEQAGSRNLLNSGSQSVYNKPAATGGARPPSSLSASMRQTATPPASLAASASPQQQQHHHQQSVTHYSPAYPNVRRSTYANRLGEQAPAQLGAQAPTSAATETPTTSTSSAHTVSLSEQLGQLLAPYEDVAEQHPLSLLAAPRGLNMGLPIAIAADAQADFNNGHTIIQNHNNNANLRFKRDTLKRSTRAANQTLNSDNQLDSNHKWQRHARHLKPEDSTAIKTQKTIQVVSPDDVAFSLLGDDRDLESQIAASGGGMYNSRSSAQAELWAKQKRAQINKQQARGEEEAGEAAERLDASLVCFSTSRFLFGVLTTLAVLVSSIVIVTYVILKQRSQLDTKLSAVYDPSALTTAASQLGHQNQLENELIRSNTSRPHHHQQHQLVAATAADSEADILAHRRQCEEIQQRNSYLARFYSQFSPATHWR